MSESYYAQTSHLPADVGAGCELSVTTAEYNNGWTRHYIFTALGQCAMPRSEVSGTTVNSAAGVHKAIDDFMAAHTLTGPVEITTDERWRLPALTPADEQFALELAGEALLPQLDLVPYDVNSTSL